MSDRRPNRWEAARDPYAAARRSPPRDYRPRARATWSLPVTTVLRWMLAILLGVVALSLFGDVALQAVRGWLA